MSGSNQPERVLHVIGAMDRGGAETLIMNIYRSMDRGAVQFDFLVHDGRECDYDAEIEHLGGRIFHLFRFTGANYLVYKKALRSFFEAHHDYCAVHVHIGSCAAIVISEAKRFGLYAVAHSHATRATLSLPEIGFRFFSYPTRFVADAYLACSRQAGVDRFGRSVVSGNRFSVLINGIDTKRYRFNKDARAKLRSQLHIDEDCPVFGHVGRFSKEKNHVFLLHVFAHILQSVPSAKLLLVGRGPLEKEIRDLPLRLSIEDSVMFLGVRDDIPDLLNVFDVFLFPSIWEGLGISAIEAQASGLPCLLSSSLPPISSIAPSVKTLSLDEGEEAWARAAERLLKESSSLDREDCSEIVRSAGFDIRDTMDALMSLYLKHDLSALQQISGSYHA